MLRQYEYKGKRYSIVNCTLEDIPSHLEKVYQFIPDEKARKEQQKWMIRSVTSSRAYKILSPANVELAYIYLKDFHDTKTMEVASWYSTWQWFLVLTYWLRSYTFTWKIYYKPWRDTQLVEWQFITETNDIIHYHETGEPIKVDLWGEKCRKAFEVFEKMDIKEVL